MSSAFASLHAGLLARKGAAAPSVEGYVPFRPRPEPAASNPPVRAEEHPAPQVIGRIPAQPQPAAVSAPAAAQQDGTPAALMRSRAGVRLTHEQLRALKLAALLLDRPQQDLIAAGVDLRLEDLACGPLEHCACFRAVIQQLSRNGG
jgi:hypothetical protein